MTQADLIRRSCLSRSTVNRIFRDTNDKGKPYRPTSEIVYAVSNALKLTKAGWLELELVAFPERKIWGDGLDKGSDIDQVNIELDNKDLNPLIKIREN